MSSMRPLTTLTLSLLATTVVAIPFPPGSSVATPAGISTIDQALPTDLALQIRQFVTIGAGSSAALEVGDGLSSKVKADGVNQSELPQTTTGEVSQVTGFPAKDGGEHPMTTASTAATVEGRGLWRLTGGKKDEKDDKDEDEDSHTTTKKATTSKTSSTKSHSSTASSASPSTTPTCSKPRQGYSILVDPKEFQESSLKALLKKENDPCNTVDYHHQADPKQFYLATLTETTKVKVGKLSGVKSVDDNKAYNEETNDGAGLFD